MKNIEVLFDNGGGMTVQNKTLGCYFTGYPLELADAAADIRTMLGGRRRRTIAKWAGAHPSYLVKDQAGYKVYRSADLIAEIHSPKLLPSGLGATELNFLKALTGRFFEDDRIGKLGWSVGFVGENWCVIRPDGFSAIAIDSDVCEADCLGSSFAEDEPFWKFWKRT